MESSEEFVEMVDELPIADVRASFFELMQQALAIGEVEDAAMVVDEDEGQV